MRHLINASDRDYLHNLLAQARTSHPADWHRWYLNGVRECLGVLSPKRAELLARMMPSHMPLIWNGRGWVWHAQSFSADERSQALETIAQALHACGEIHGWRHELYACWGNTNDAWPYDKPELFRLERAAFRFFGLRSHAAHVHGVTSAEKIWCGRRALSKATDPGMLDNLAAGGLPADEEPDACAVREIYEEAGLDRTIFDLGRDVREVLTERVEPEGWHSERLFIYAVSVKDDERPSNRDGEVSEFICLDVAEILQRLRANEFTKDAGCVIAIALLNA